MSLYSICSIGLVAALSMLSILECASTTKLKKSYVAISILMIAFAVWRPIGISRDDFAYIKIYNGVCTLHECNELVRVSKDWGWFFLVSILKTLFESPRVILYLAGAALTIKLLCLYRIVPRPMVALLLYFSMYYQLVDLTTFRFSLSIAAIFLAMNALVANKKIAASAWNISAVIFHKQAILSIVYFLGSKISSRFIPVMVVGAFISLTMVGLYPSYDGLIFGGSIFKNIIGTELDNYVFAKENGVYESYVKIPLVVFPTLALGLVLLDKIYIAKDKLYGLFAVSLVSASISIWFFADLPGVQNRMFEFMIIPIIFMAGFGNIGRFGLFSVILTSWLYAIKYNIANQLIG